MDEGDMQRQQRRLQQIADAKREREEAERRAKEQAEAEKREGNQ